MILGSLTILAGLGVVTARPASAVNPTIAVTTTADVINGSDGVLSLREAVIEANADAGADTIELATSATYRITLCDGIAAQEDASASGDLDATDVAGLTISGGGSEIQNGCDAGGDDESIIENRAAGGLHLDHLTLRFAAFLAQRSGVESVGPVSLDTVDLVGIGANAVHTSVGGLTAVDSTMEQNRNGLDIAGDAELTDCIVRNQVERGMIAHGHLAIHGSSIVRNTEGVLGHGGVQIDHTNIEQVTDGSDPGQQLLGGGAITAEGVLDLTDSTIRHNRSTSGEAAGVNALGGGTIQRTVIQGNVGVAMHG
ncbi:MAG: CSLREA domain-containing protein, partial [Acidimicrobiales bacterium]